MRTRSDSRIAKDGKEDNVHFGIAGVTGLLLVALAACANDHAGQRTVVRDSSGITIVTNSRPVWDSDGWSLAGEPALRIGVVDGDSAYQLHRVLGALRLSDGRIVITNDGSREVRYFDAAGRHLFSIGRSGQGPGEFMSMLALIPTGADTVLVADNALGRISVFDSDGELVGTRPGVAPVGVLRDGSVVSQLRRLPPDRSFQNGPSRDEALLIRHPPDHVDPDTIARLEGNESVILIESDGRTSGATGYARPFGLVRMTSTHGNSIHTADGAQPEIRVLDANGSLQRIVRLDLPGRPVTAADQTAYRERFLGMIPPGPSRDRAENALEGDAFPEFLPAFQTLRHDRVGNLWLEDYRADPAEPPRWTVLDPEGRWLGSVATPPGFRVADIGDDYVLGIARDELDVEHVLLYTLRKEAAAPE
jgi:hypothetical protein